MLKEQEELEEFILAEQKKQEEARIKQQKAIEAARKGRMPPAPSGAHGASRSLSRKNL